MRDIKHWLSLILIAILVLSLTIPVFAFDRPEHDKTMVRVLFGDLKVIRNDPNVNALAAASYLAIDQFNHSGESDLALLKNSGIKNLPKTIDEISFTAGGINHRSYTHRGWDYSYLGEMQTKWPIRKNILLNTADGIFNFKGNDKQKESFCKLIYYIHLLGDHQSDTSYIVNNGLKMDVGGRNDNQSIIKELIQITKDLFPEQKNTNRYRGLISQLNEYDSNLKMLVQSEGGINSEEKFKQYQKIVNEMVNVISLYYSKMLYHEPFFKDVFY